MCYELGQNVSLVRDRQESPISSARTKYDICFQRVTGDWYENHLIETVSQSETVSQAPKCKISLDFGFGRGQIAGLDGI